MGNHISSDKLQRLISQGKVFFVEFVLTAQANPVITHWKTGDKPVHFIATKWSGLKTIYTMAKDAVCSNNGTLQNIYNKNGNFDDNDLLMKRYLTPTITGAGTVISTTQTGVAAAPGQAAQSIATDSPSVMRKNSSYILTVTPSAACDIGITLLFWEE